MDGDATALPDLSSDRIHGDVDLLLLRGAEVANGDVKFTEAGALQFLGIVRVFVEVNQERYASTCECAHAFICDGISRRDYAGFDLRPIQRHGALGPSGRDRRDRLLRERAWVRDVAVEE